MKFKYLQNFLLAFLFIANCAFAHEVNYEALEVATGFDAPTAIEITPDGRMLVAQKNGIIFMLKNNQVQASPVLTLNDVNTYGDRGLLGMEIDPDFENNGYIYLLYTYENSPGQNFTGPKSGRLVRYTIIGDIASPSSKLVLIGQNGGSNSSPSCSSLPTDQDCIYSDSSSHSIADLKFGENGNLYVSMGDGANFNFSDPASLRVQNPDKLSGKVLRINKEGKGLEDNPFYDGNPDSNRSKVYSLGFRNPFRLSYDNLNQKMYVGDVGLGSFEEINFLVPGKNYGWPCYEGSVQTPNGLGCNTPTINDTPFYHYPHVAPDGGSVTLGNFLNSSIYSHEATGTIIIGDYAQNWIKKLVPNASSTGYSLIDIFAGNIAMGPVDFEMGPDGVVYFISIYSGSIKKILPNEGNRLPTANPTADIYSGNSPLTVTFSANAQDLDLDTLSFLWTFENGNTSTSSNPSYTFLTNGIKNVSLRVDDGNGGIIFKNVSINIGNNVPDIKYITPMNGSLYTNYQFIEFNSYATDIEDGELPESAYAWKYILHHNTHLHTMQEGQGRKILIDTGNHQASDVHIEMELTVTDSQGSISKKSSYLYFNSNLLSAENQISNPSVEIEDVTPNQEVYSPVDWTYDNYNVTGYFNYPVAGVSGNKAVMATIQNIAGPDAYIKWHYKSISVAQKEDYVFYNYYKSNANTKVLLAYTLADGSKRYITAKTLAPSSDWKKNYLEITTPEDVVNLIVMQDLSEPGYIVTDNYFFAHKDASKDHSIDESATTTVSKLGDNLFLNPSLEIASTTNQQFPLNWQRNKWGNGQVNFTYSNSGFDSLRSTKVGFSSISSGDAKWFPDYINTSTGTYSISYFYKSTSTSSPIVRFVDSLGRFEHQKLADLASSSQWKIFTATITPRFNTVKMTILPIIESIGNLEVDEFHLFRNSTSTQKVNLLFNPDLEQGTTLPTSYQSDKWGVNIASHLYGNFGLLGSKAIKVVIDSISSGDAKWVGNYVSVLENREYKYESYYKSNVETELVLQERYYNGTVQYHNIADLPTTQGFKKTENIINIKPGVKEIKILHVLKSVGFLIQDNLYLGLN